MSTDPFSSNLILDTTQIGDGLMSKIEVDTILQELSEVKKMFDESQNRAFDTKLACREDAINEAAEFYDTARNHLLNADTKLQDTEMFLQDAVQRNQNQLEIQKDNAGWKMAALATGTLASTVAAGVLLTSVAPVAAIAIGAGVMVKKGVDYKNEAENAAFQLERNVGSLNHRITATRKELASIRQFVENVCETDLYPRAVKEGIVKDSKVNRETYCKITF